MKSLYESLLDDFDTLNSNIDREMVKKFLKDNYDGKYTISKTPNKNGLYEVSSKGNIFGNKNIQSLTNNLFIWKKIDGKFVCSYCAKLTSLKGAPEKVGDYFDCSHCKSLTSLEGAPKNIKKGFYCSYCAKLTSLKGAPEKVGGEFNCSYCKSLTSLEGAPKTVGYYFTCEKCKVKFTKQDVKTISNVVGSIYV